MSHRRSTIGRSRRSFRPTVAALAAVAAFTAAAAVGAPAASADTGALAQSAPAGLVQSTGNLYWTANTRGLVFKQRHTDVKAHLQYIATVWRASKSNVPGQERALYQEASFSQVQFGAIKWALVDGQYYGYFVANYPDQGISMIKRVSLAGGTAVTLATSPGQIGDRDLVAGATNLYWADSTGIRKMPINGGAIKTLVRGTTFERLALDGSYVYYGSVVTGPNGVAQGNLNRVPKAGGTRSVLTATSGGISALDTLATPNYTEYYLGLTNGTVEQGTTLGGISYVLQAAAPGTIISSISRDATNGDILWGQQNIVTGLDLAVAFHNGTTGAVATNAPPLGVQGDGGAMYWGDQQLEKTTL